MIPPAIIHRSKLFAACFVALGLVVAMAVLSGTILSGSSASSIAHAQDPAATPAPTATPGPAATPDPAVTPEPTGTPVPVATLEPTVVPAPASTALFRLFSEPGEIIAAPITGLGLAGGSEFSGEQVRLELLDAGRVQVKIFSEDSATTPVFRIVLGAPDATELSESGYPNARQSTFPDPSVPELQFERIQRDPAAHICSESLGLFEVLEITFESGQLATFAADFQFSCNTSGEGPWSFGSIRFNSTFPQDDATAAPHRTLNGTVTGPDGQPLVNVLVCPGVRGQFQFETISASCRRTDSAGRYTVEADMSRTPAGQGFGEFYVFFFATEQMYLRQECFNDRSEVSCERVDWINVSRGVSVNSKLDAQLEYGCWTRRATIIGTPEGGFIAGTEGDDVIVSFDGDDLIASYGGNDFICPGNGINTVYAGDGDDLIAGGIDADALSGQDGDDFIWGNRGVDRLRGGNGNDELRGDAGNDDLNGGRDDDVVLGDSGDDLVRGGTGDDLVLGGPGADTVAGNGGVDTVNGDAGDDVLVSGGPRGDIVNGGSGDDLVKGLGGADVVSGQEGNDDVRGGKGIDSINGGEGFDICNGGEGLSDRAVDCESVVNIAVSE